MSDDTPEVNTEDGLITQIQTVRVLMHDSGEEYYEVDFLVHPDEDNNTTKTYQTFIDEANPIIILVREWEDAGGIIE
jgi:hypothetical protein